jgi:uncharacterized protein YdcH (DUF465 family)
MRNNTIPVIQPGLFVIMQRFPQYRDALRHLYLNNESFQTICDDYRKCSNALSHWTQSKHEEAPERCSEYLGLLRDLESEIKQSLGESH